MDISNAGLIKYLQAFGYDLGGTVREMVELYQQFIGLPVTGVFDQATIVTMCERRCNHPDPIGKAAQTMKWRKNDLTWKFVNYTLDIPQHEISASFNAGFGVWSAVTPLTFKEVLGQERADIEITFKTLDTQGQVLAQAWFPESGRMEFDEAEKWSFKLPLLRGEVDLATVVAHEAGHTIGLEHSNVRGSQMAPVYAGPMRFLTPDDIARAQSLYGSRG